MREVTLEQDPRPVEEVVTGEGGMERGSNRGLAGYLGIGKVGKVTISPNPTPAVKMFPVGGGSLTVSGSLTTQLSAADYQRLYGGSGLTPAKPGTTASILERKLLHQLIVQGHVPATVKTIADLPAGTQMSQHDSPADDSVTYEFILPTGATFRYQMSRLTLSEMKTR